MAKKGRILTRYRWTNGYGKASRYNGRFADKTDGRSRKGASGVKRERYNSVTKKTVRRK